MAAPVIAEVIINFCILGSFQLIIFPVDFGKCRSGMTALTRRTMADVLGRKRKTHILFNRKSFRLQTARGLE